MLWKTAKNLSRTWLEGERTRMEWAHFWVVIDGAFFRTGLPGFELPASLLLNYRVTLNTRVTTPVTSSQYFITFTFLFRGSAPIAG